MTIFAPFFQKKHGVVLEWLKRHAWKACLRQKRNGGSNPPHSAVFPFAGGVFGDVVIGGKMLQDVASGSRMLDKCWTNSLNVGQKHENRERMKGVRTCNTEFFTCPVEALSSLTSSVLSHAVSPSTARTDANNDFVFISYNFVGLGNIPKR